MGTEFLFGIMKKFWNWMVVVVVVTHNMMVLYICHHIAKYISKVKKSQITVFLKTVI